MNLGEEERNAMVSLYRLYPSCQRNDRNHSGND